MLTLTSPIETWAHRLPAAAKLAALCGFTLLVFSLSSALPLLAALTATALLIASGGRQFARQSLKSLRPLWPFVAILTLWHLITRDTSGLPILLRMISAVAAANFVTMTTRLADMIAVIRGLARPLARLIPAQSLALAMALTLRFIPVMLLRTEAIAESWRARSPRRAGWRILIPATLAALDDAEQVAEALRARGGLG